MENRVCKFKAQLDRQYKYLLKSIEGIFASKQEKAKECKGIYKILPTKQKDNSKNNNNDKEQKWNLVKTDIKIKIEDRKTTTDKNEMKKTTTTWKSSTNIVDKERKNR